MLNVDGNGIDGWLFIAPRLIWSEWVLRGLVRHANLLLNYQQMGWGNGIIFYAYESSNTLYFSPQSFMGNEWVTEVH